MKHLLLIIFALCLFGCGHKAVETYTGPVSKENPAPSFGSSDTVCLPGLPSVTVGKIVEASEIRAFIYKAFRGASLEQLADSSYAILDRDSVLRLVAYAPEFTWAQGLEWTEETFDCDNFAKLWSQGAQLALWKRYGGSVKGQALVGVIYVHQDHDWGGVLAGGAHALNAAAAWGPNGLEIIIIEPQTGKWTTHDLYPNEAYRIKIE